MNRRGILFSALVALSMLPSQIALAQTADAVEAPRTGRDTLLTGIYSDQWEAGHDLSGLSATTPFHLSLAGTFHLLRESEDGWSPAVTDRLLEQVWSAKATPLANVNVKHSAYQVARGDADADIALWAGRVRGWLDRGEGRSLLIAPMQEMNGNWVPYGMDPANYRIAFRRFVTIARANGLDETGVRWVFAPNGWSVPPHTMADYYPGDDIVDVVGLSAYNFGAIVDFWTPVDWAITAALEEARTFAPLKPFVIAQVGSSTAGGDRDAWIREMFRVTARDPNVVGLVYFNFNKETDWKIWDGVQAAPGWLDGSTSRAVRHIWPLTGWFMPGPIPFQPHEGRFADDDLIPVRDDIDWLAELGIFTGCAENSFCPDRIVTRAQLASLLARALRLPESALDAYPDDADSSHESAINAVAAAGLIEGCNSKRFCPQAPATRDVLRAALAAASSALEEDPTFAPTPDPAKADPICPSARYCQKKSLTRTYVAAALSAYLRQHPHVGAPEEGMNEPAGRPWWHPPI